MITKLEFHIPGSTSHKQVLRIGKRIVVGVLSCYEIYFDTPDMNSACERNTVMLFSKTRNATFAVFMIL